MVPLKEKQFLIHQKHTTKEWENVGFTVKKKKKNTDKVNNAFSTRDWSEATRPGANICFWVLHVELQTHIDGAYCVCEKHSKVLRQGGSPSLASTLVPYHTAAVLGTEC